jgi:hypothetical protein
MKNDDKAIAVAVRHHVMGELVKIYPNNPKTVARSKAATVFENLAGRIERYSFKFWKWNAT